MKAFSGARGMSIMTWVKITGEAPARNSNSSGTSDRYGAIGIAGVLSGDSDGHAARALLETENHDGAMRLIALVAVPTAVTSSSSSRTPTGRRCCR